MARQPRMMHVPYTLERDEDGVWCAHAWLGSSGGANGNGATPEEAVADLREAVRMVLGPVAAPQWVADGVTGWRYYVRTVDSSLQVSEFAGSQTGSQ